MDGHLEPPHSCSLRRGRYSIPNQIYLVTTVTVDRQPVFINLFHGRKVVQALMAYQDCATTLCFVVMPDHLHWLMHLSDKYSLSKTVAGIKRYSSRRINADLGIKDALWQDGFHDRAIRQEEDIRQIARYIIGNPLRADLVNHVGEYSLWDAIWLE